MIAQKGWTPACDADCLLNPTLNPPPMHCLTWKGKAGGTDSQAGLETVQTPYKESQGITCVRHI